MDIMTNVSNSIPNSKSKCEHSKEGGLLQAALHSLKSKGLKLTSARKLILSYLTKAHGPFTIEEIHAGIRSKNCDLVTVYRTLDTLEELGLVRKYDIGDRVARFEFLCAEHPHHHLICKGCKKVEVIDTDLLGEVKKLATKKGFSKIAPSFDFFGVCRDCDKQKAANFR
jgi:Fur family ferric uptake transcriptional regulator